MLFPPSQSPTLRDNPRNTFSTFHVSYNGMPYSSEEPVRSTHYLRAGWLQYEDASGFVIDSAVLLVCTAVA